MTSIIKVDTIQDQSGNNIINENADTITIGASGDTITIPSGATLANNGTVTGIPASAIDSGTIATARLGTGTASSSTFLRGDQTYAAAGLSGWSEDGANNNLLPANASAGIYLGVSSATAANLLDDYEEGTWTPAYSFVSGSAAYSSQDGRYTKIGNLVAFTVSIATSSISSPSGNVGITGLPFTPDTEAGAAIGLAYRWGTDITNLRIRTASGGTMQLWKSATNATSPTQVQGSDLTSGTAYNNITFSGIYNTTT
jgi:hypothetical protein